MSVIQSTVGIPGSFSVQGSELLDGDLRMKSAEEIKEIFEGHGVDVTKPMVFCSDAGYLNSLTFACALDASLPGQLYFCDGAW